MNELLWRFLLNLAIYSTLWSIIYAIMYFLERRYWRNYEARFYPQAELPRAWVRGGSK